MIWWCPNSYNQTLCELRISLSSHTNKKLILRRVEYSILGRWKKFFHNCYALKHCKIFCINRGSVLPEAQGTLVGIQLPNLYGNKKGNGTAILNIHSLCFCIKEH